MIFNLPSFLKWLVLSANASTGKKVMKEQGWEDLPGTASNKITHNKNHIPKPGEARQRRLVQLTEQE